MTTTTTSATFTQLELALLRTDGNTASRVKLDEFVIEEYVQALVQGAKFPPLVAFYDGNGGSEGDKANIVVGNYWLCDGFHRLAALLKLYGAGFIYEVEVHVGSLRAARLFSASVNTAHGLRRTNADKRRAVNLLLNDKEWREWSSNEIARHCGVGRSFVNNLRNQLPAILPPWQDSSNLHPVNSTKQPSPQAGSQAPSQRLVQRNGNTYPMNVSRIGSTSHYHESPLPADKAQPSTQTQLRSSPLDQPNPNKNIHILIPFPPPAQTQEVVGVVKPNETASNTNDDHAKTTNFEQSLIVPSVTLVPVEIEFENKAELAPLPLRLVATPIPNQVTPTGPAPVLNQLTQGIVTNIDIRAIELLADTNFADDPSLKQHLALLPLDKQIALALKLSSGQSPNLRAGLKDLRTEQAVSRAREAADHKLKSLALLADSSNPNSSTLDFTSNADDKEKDKEKEETAAQTNSQTELPGALPTALVSLMLTPTVLEPTITEDDDDNNEEPCVSVLSTSPKVTNRIGQGWHLTSEQGVVKCDALITDPPYGILDEEWEPQTQTELEAFTLEWASRWNECEAQSIIIFWSERYLWQGRQWFDQALSNYEYVQLLIWHYPNNIKPLHYPGFKITYDPIFYYRKRGSFRKVSVNPLDWGKAGLNTFNCYVSATPQSNYGGANFKQHPAQKPIEVMRWLVAATTNPHDLICDPFGGSCTTGVAALQLERRFWGIETNPQYLDLATQRLILHGTPLSA